MTRDEILSLAREAGIEVHPRKEIARIGLDSLTGCDSTDKLAKFAELATAKERTARIEAQQRLADAQELAAKSGLAHRKAVQEAVSEAVAAERKRITDFLTAQISCEIKKIVDFIDECCPENPQ